ncbi:MAG: ATP-dependent helicase [Deltaproteobacteria bacterium]|nr:ATP-dependent helicase [Deltaproteobacteria bacterium]
MNVPDFARILNPSQLEAATHEGGPLLVIAGAGSGKTRTLVHRVAWLVSRGVPPRGILLLTFTRKAAREMLERCEGLVGPAAGRVSGGTFHSLANSLLRAEHRAAGFPAGFGILDQDDAENMIGRIREGFPAAKSARGYPKKAKILQVVSRAINEERTVKETIHRWFRHLEAFASDIGIIAEEYAGLKRASAVMDFDDLLVNLAAVMAGDESVRERIASRFTHVLVDEYQDTNPVQARIAWLLARDHRSVTAVGDDAQSIYGFRGADYRNIMEFPQIFAPARILKLEDNYRSLGGILRVANGILKGAPARYEKVLRPVRGEGPPPVMALVKDAREEARWVGGHIAGLVREGADPAEIAVLFRAAAHSFELELELARLNVPYTKYGGRRFLEAAHVKDFLAFLRVAHNPADLTSLARVLSLHPGIGQKGAAEAARWAAGDRPRLLAFSGAPLRGRAAQGARGLAPLLAAVCGEEDAMGERPRLILDYYSALMPGLYPDDHPDRLEDVRELAGMAESSGSLSAFLADVTLDPPNSASSRGAGEGPRSDVSLSTIHSAKGLEWGRVFLLSAVEGRIPSSYAVAREEEMEEERRLFYVAVTRAKDELYIMCPSETSGGWEGPLKARPTRFLRDVGEGAVDVIQSGRKVAWCSVYPRDTPEAGDGDGSFSDGYGWGPSFSGDAQLARTLPPPREREPWRPEPAGEAVAEPVQGDRVCHRTFGEGLVVSVRDGKAIIDFDACGRKLIVFRHARLYRPRG